MDIKTPIATWVLARLFDEDVPISEKGLVRKLCQASFATMTNDDDFDKIMEQLKEEEYIEYTDQQITEFIPIPTTTASFLPSEPKMQEVKKIHSGYVITKKGIITFRRQITTPIEKIEPHLEKLEKSKIEKFKQVTDYLKSQSDVLLSSVKLCINNAPLVIDFIKTTTNELAIIGISIT